MKYKIENFTIVLNYADAFETKIDIDNLYDPMFEIKFDKGSIDSIRRFSDQLQNLVKERRFRYNELGSKVEVNLAFIWDRILTKMVYKLLEEDDKESFLYFMKNQDGLIKIGISQDPDKRRKQLQSVMKDQIELIKVLPFPNYERLLHKKFIDYNAYYKDQIEWFHPYPDLIDFVYTVEENNFDKMFKKIKIKNVEKK